MERLRAVVFRSFPERIPSANLKSMDGPEVLESLAPRPLLFRGVNERDLLKVTQIYESAQAGGKLSLD